MLPALALAACAAQGAALQEGPVVDCQTEKEAASAEVMACAGVCAVGDACCAASRCSLVRLKEWKRYTRALCNYSWLPAWPDPNLTAAESCLPVVAQHQHQHRHRRRRLDLRAPG